MTEATLVTGGLGFIGSAFVRQMVESGGHPLVVDLETYAGDRRRLSDIEESYELVRLDVAESGFQDFVAQRRPACIIHFAAETHVTRSEVDVSRVKRTNVEGTRTVLDAALRAGTELVIHVSTDEVYGPCLRPTPFREEEKEPGEGRATSTYAKSKALADDVALGYRSQLPVIVVRPANCYGPWQHPEKAVARWTIRAIERQGLPVWGDGLQSRDWMYIDDLCAAIRLIADKGEPGSVYNIAPQGEERSNLEVARIIARAAGVPEEAVYLTAYDRPDHDRRYAVDASRVLRLGWDPQVDFIKGIERTVSWYSKHKWWWQEKIGDAESLYDDDDERPRIA